VCPSGGSWSHGAHDSPGAILVVLCPKTGAGSTGHMAVPELPRALAAGATAMRHAVALELPCARGRELRDTRACAPILPFVFDLKLICGGVRSSGYQQWPPGPPRERLRTRVWGLHPSPCNLSEFCMLGF
jgi:hypothetical protein